MHISFRFTDSAIPGSSSLIQNLKHLACFCDRHTDRFVSDLVGNTNSWLSHAKAHNRFGNALKCKEVKNGIRCLVACLYSLSSNQNVKNVYIYHPCTRIVLM